MKVIVCGAGQVGYNIARYLAHEDNDVVVIDHSNELTRKISDTLDVKAITGFASEPAVLEQAGAADADLLIAVTQADEVNMVACQIAHSLFDITTKIARIRNQGYLDPKWGNLFTRDNMPIDVIISPEREVARAVSSRLRVPGAFETISLVEDKVKLIGVRCEEDCPVVNTPLRQLTQLFPELNVLVVGIVRDQNKFIPSGEDQLSAGDGVYFTRASRSGTMPILSVAEVHTSGATWPARTAVRRPASSSSCVSVPDSKNFSIRLSSASATISIKASRAVFAEATISSGMSSTEGLPLLPEANTSAFMATRSTTPRKDFSLPIGTWIGTMVRPSTS